jgi:hypothetical protein
MENVDKIISFYHFSDYGLALPTCSFFRGLLYFYGLELHHLNPNSICHIAIFIHFCEAFLGIEPHWDLFRYLFRVKPQPTSKNPSIVGGAGIQLRQQASARYLSYKFHSNIPGWKSHLFYIGNHIPQLPERSVKEMYKFTLVSHDCSSAIMLCRVACLSLPPYAGCGQTLPRKIQEAKSSREWPPGTPSKGLTHIRSASKEHVSSERAQKAEAGADARNMAPQERSPQSSEVQLRAPRTAQRAEKGAPRHALSSLEYFLLAIYLEFLKLSSSQSLGKS